MPSLTPIGNAIVGTTGLAKQAYFSYIELAALLSPYISGGGSGTVTSVNITPGTGIGVSGGPITTSGSITVTNTAPDQVVVLNNGTGISVTGTYPNFTITNTGTVTSAALTKVDDTNVTLTLGGTPASALLQAVTLTLGWTGTLADGRIASSANWNTAYTNRITSLTTTGSSGAATLVSNVLNIPNYTLTGLGGVPSTRNITINGTTLDLSADRTWTISSLPPSGSAGGDLTGTYPNPTVNQIQGKAIASLVTGLFKYDGTSWVFDTSTYLTANQTITLSGEASGSGTTSISVTLSNAAVIGKVLTGYVSGAGTISASDSILSAIQKLNGNIGALTTGVSSVNSLTGAVPLTGTAGQITISGSNVFALANNTAIPGSPTTTTQAQNDNSTKIATTAYTDLAIANAIAGVNPAIAVEVATTANLSGYTYNNGVSGIGATLTQNSAAVVVIDGYTLLLLDRVLIKDQTTAANNGVYFISTLGTGVIPAVFTRALDYNQPSDINDTGAIPVVNGTVNGTTQWVITSKVTTVGTSSITYTKFTINPSSIVQTSRQITVNGTTQDLSADRTYTVTDANLSVSDITTNNSSTSNHGFLKKLDNVATHYMDGTGAWSTPAASFVGLVETISLNDIGSAIPAQTYTLDFYAEYGYTINELKIISTSGTCTAAVQIGGTNVTGISAVSVSSTVATGTATAANTVSTGNKVTLVLSSNSSLVNLQATLKITRT